MKCPKCHSENPDTSRFCNNCGSSFGVQKELEFAPTKTLETPVQAIPKGSMVAGKYKIIEEIGRGGMGIVYKAEDTKLRRVVALKFLPQQWISDKETRERFIHEARAASALDHPNVCTIYEIEETEDGRMYIAMAFYEGESLREKTKRVPLKTEEAVAIASQVAKGMAKAHQKGIVHRDIKPGNILVTNDGVAKIVDFGLAKLAGQAKMTREGTTVGTVAYMSPEQARGDAVDQRTDIWSLGVVLYEMLSGRLPFKGDYEQSLIHSILKSEPEPITKFRKDLPSGLAQIITKALAKNPTVRYQSMDELLEDLNAIAEGLKPIRAKVGLFRGKVLGIKKVYAYIGLAAVIILAAIALLFLFPKRVKIYDSLAVLPFENLSKDTAPDFPADVLSGEIIQNFYMIGAIRVPRLQTVMDYRNTKKSYRQIGQELNVKAILCAEMQFIGKAVRISARLIDAETELPLWTHTYDRDGVDILTLQMGLAQDIVRETRVKLMPFEQTKLDSAKAALNKVNLQAYDLYLRAKKIYTDMGRDPSSERWQTAYKYIQQAIDIDPEFASIYFLLSDYYGFGHAFGFMPYKDAITGAEAALNKGLSLEPDSAEAHFAAGEIKFLKWDWEGAANEFRRAAELAPGNAIFLGNHSNVVLALGQFDEAIAELKRTYQIDPSSDPDRIGLAEWYGNSRRYDEAIAVLRESIRSNPDNARLHNTLAWIYSWKGMHAEAVAEGEKSLKLLTAPDKTFLNLNVAQVYAFAGRRNDALKLLDDYLTFQKEKGRPVDAYGIASVYSVLGDKDEAFKWLERAVQDHSYMMQWLKIDKPMDNLRSDPRYKEYLKKAGFEK